ncbi:hypothetical protein fugu_007985 [Takifugu bimaculatus]|uniref:Uncharacterized protein n=1 Tax=Takifugu bimaculatus TaxID=433685 RepID=A0A4Z2B042_9TELE|nr:hypothetical protein fugu_007985 [Takifugu bimaculatus]
MKLQFAEFWKCFKKGSCVNFLFKEVLKTLIPTFFFLLLLEMPSTRSQSNAQPTLDFPRRKSCRVSSRSKIQDVTQALVQSPTKLDPPFLTQTLARIRPLSPRTIGPPAHPFVTHRFCGSASQPAATSSTEPQENAQGMTTAATSVSAR